MRITIARNPLIFIGYLGIAKDHQRDYRTFKQAFQHIIGIGFYCLKSAPKSDAAKIPAVFLIFTSDFA